MSVIVSAEKAKTNANTETVLTAEEPASGASVNKESIAKPEAQKRTVRSRKKAV
jgi:hypothetical protein